MLQGTRKEDKPSFPFLPFDSLLEVVSLNPFEHAFLMSCDYQVKAGLLLAECFYDFLGCSEYTGVTLKVVKKGSWSKFTQTWGNRRFLGST